MSLDLLMGWLHHILHLMLPQGHFDLLTSYSSEQGSRAFSAVAPKLWIELPTHIRLAHTFHIFKVYLKTHFYSLVFNLN